VQRGHEQQNCIVKGSLLEIEDTNSKVGALAAEFSGRHMGLCPSLIISALLSWLFGIVMTNLLMFLQKDFFLVMILFGLQTIAFASFYIQQ